MSIEKPFEGMPDEVFVSWLLPEIERRGWPFGGDEQRVADPVWARYLRNNGPGFWRSVTWEKTCRRLSAIPIEIRATDIAKRLAELGTRFSLTGIAEPTIVPKSPQKVAAIASVTLESGRTPQPLIFLIQEGEWWLMDGHHRLAAVFMLEDFHNFTLDAWVGTPAR